MQSFLPDWEPKDGIYITLKDVTGVKRSSEAIDALFREITDVIEARGFKLHSWGVPKPPEEETENDEISPNFKKDVCTSITSIVTILENVFRKDPLSGEVPGEVYRELRNIKGMMTDHDSQD